MITLETRAAGASLLHDTRLLSNLSGMDEAGIDTDLDLDLGEGQISSVSVKLRGLPFKALEQDISDFFEGYNVQRALLKRYPDGRPNGEVPAATLSRPLR